MQNTSTVQVASSEKGENRGKTYRIPISNGIFEHYPKVKDAMWLLLLYVDWTTREVRAADGSLDGIVLGGKPVSDAYVAGAFPVNGGPSERSIRAWRNLLARYGYIAQKRTGSGYIITVKKSKKWPQGDRQQVPTRSAESSDHSDSDRQKLPIRSAESSDQIGKNFRSRSDSTRTRQGLCKEAEAPETGATPTTTNQSSPVLKDCWTVLGLTMPIGGVSFQGDWEAFYANSTNHHLQVKGRGPHGEHASGAGCLHVVDIMEEFIQFKLTRGQKDIPPKFYDAKHSLEREDKEMDREIEEAQRWAEAQKELETQAQVILMAPLPAETPALPERAGQAGQLEILTERETLALVLREPAALANDPRVSGLVAENFQRERHQVIFHGMKYLKRNGPALTMDTLIALLQRRDELDRAGGEGYIRALVDVDVAPARKEATA